MGCGLLDSILGLQPRIPVRFHVQANFHLFSLISSVQMYVTDQLDNKVMVPEAGAIPDAYSDKRDSHLRNHSRLCTVSNAELFFLAHSV